MKEVGQIVPDSTRLCLLCKQREILVLPDTIWSASLKLPANFWSRKPDRKNQQFSSLALSGTIISLYVQHSTGLAEKTIRAFYSTKTVISTKMVVCCSSLINCTFEARASIIAKAPSTASDYQNWILVLENHALSF